MEIQERNQTHDPIHYDVITELKVIKRNGTIVHFDENKIKIAINKAFVALEGIAAASSDRARP